MLIERTDTSSQAPLNGPGSKLLGNCTCTNVQTRTQRVIKRFVIRTPLCSISCQTTGMPRYCVSVATKSSTVSTGHDSGSVTTRSDRRLSGKNSTDIEATEVHYWEPSLKG
eukprot:5291902-Pyramimonas_sp.AAC.1